MTVPIVNETIGVPGTFTCTATIVRLRMRIRTFALCLAFGPCAACVVSATMPPTHWPGTALDGARTVKCTVT